MTKAEVRAFFDQEIRDSFKTSAEPRQRFVGILTNLCLCTAEVTGNEPSPMAQKHEGAGEGAEALTTGVLQ